MDETAEKAEETTDEAIALELYPRLRRFAAVVAPREIAPDDLVHDALVAVLRRGSLIRLDDPEVYLRRTMLNLAANQRRRLGRGRRAGHRLTGGEGSPALDAYPSDLAHLASLDPDARAVLYLHHVEGHSYDSIARQLGLRPATARQRAHRARKALRALLEEE